MSRGCEGIKPGWTRVSFNYFISEAVFEYIVAAVDLVATHGWRLLPAYRFDPLSGLWRHRAGHVEPPLRLTDLSYDADTGELVVPDLAARPRARVGAGRVPRRGAPHPRGRDGALVPRRVGERDLRAAALVRAARALPRLSRASRTSRQGTAASAGRSSSSRSTCASAGKKRDHADRDRDRQRRRRSRRPARRRRAPPRRPTRTRRARSRR